MVATPRAYLVFTPTIGFSKLILKYYKYSIMTTNHKNQPIVLVLGSIGQVGKLIVETLKQTTDVQVRVTSLSTNGLHRSHARAKQNYS